MPYTEAGVTFAYDQATLYEMIAGAQTLSDQRDLAVAAVQAARISGTTPTVEQIALARLPFPGWTVILEQALTTHPDKVWANIGYLAASYTIQQVKDKMQGLIDIIKPHQSVQALWRLGKLLLNGIEVGQFSINQNGLQGGASWTPKFGIETLLDGPGRHNSRHSWRALSDTIPPTDEGLTGQANWLLDLGTYIATNFLLKNGQNMAYNTSQFSTQGPVAWHNRKVLTP